MHLEPRRSAALALTCVAAIWGTNFSVVKRALAELEPSALAALRFAIATVAFVIVLLVTEGLGRPTRAQWVRLTLLGLIGNTAYQLCHAHGLARMSPSHASLLAAVTPMLVAGLSQLQGRERMTRAMAAGLTLAVLGVSLVVTVSEPFDHGGARAGDVLILIAAICWALYTVGVRDIGGSLSPAQVTGLTLLTGTPGLLLAGAPALARQDWGHVSAAAWGAVVFSSLVAVVVAFLLWNRSVREIGANRTAVFHCMVPAVATLTAWATLGQRPSFPQAMGGGLIVAGILVALARPAYVASSAPPLPSVH